MRLDRVCRAQTIVQRRSSRRGLMSVGFPALLSLALFASTSSLAQHAVLADWPGPVPSSLVLPSLGTDTIDLAVHKGRIVFVHFFATWCEPCRRELPALDRLRADAGSDIAVLAISVAEPDDRVRRYFNAAPVGFPVLLDRDRAVSRAWDAFTLPTTFILDRALRPLHRADGEVDWNEARVRETVRAAIAASSTHSPSVRQPTTR